MLGKVFESLLDVTERKKEGIFYTPRAIVEFKCKESLKYYLSDELEKSKLKLNPDQLDKVLDRTVDELNSTNEKKQFELIYNKLLNLVFSSIELIKSAKYFFLLSRITAA